MSSRTLHNWQRRVTEYRGDFTLPDMLLRLLDCTVYDKTTLANAAIEHIFVPITIKSLSSHLLSRLRNSNSERERERERESAGSLHCQCTFQFVEKVFLNKGCDKQSMYFLTFVELWTTNISSEVAPHIFPHCVVLIICQKHVLLSPWFSSLGLPVQKFHRKMMSFVLRIPVQWNVTLLEITVQVWRTFGMCTKLLFFL